MPTLDDIEHFVVLMLENRSFDNIFGFLYPDKLAADFDGLAQTPGAHNPDPGGGAPIAPWTDDGNPPAAQTMPDPNPAERFDDMTRQLYGDGAPGGRASMDGFTSNYAAHGGRPHDIMHCFTPTQLPALSALAQHYAVCDRWFASAPCETWPNRFFVHTGTANGYENNTLEGFPFHMQTIFNELEGVAPWKIYSHDFAQTTMLSRLWPYMKSNFASFDAFAADADSPDMPAYCFIEPQYYPGERMPNDMHPPHHVGYADALVAQVYNTVRKSRHWGSTMLIVLFDEHGGCYDHVPPPAAVPPEPPRPGQKFAFDRYGARVPAVVVSPYTAPGTVLRADAGQPPYDHTSIPRTLRKRFGIAAPLSAREATAPDLGKALNSAQDVDHAPAALPVAAPAGAAHDLVQALAAPLNRLQMLMHQAADALEPLAQGAPADQHLAQTVAPAAPPAPSAEPANAAVAGMRMADLMQRLQS